MALDPTVNNVVVTDGTEFQKNNTTSSYEQYRFYIGTHGPFIEKFYAGEQDSPAIERRINMRVAKLREMGLLDPVAQS